MHDWKRRLQINNTIKEYSRDWAALVYLFICLIDFFVAPLVWNLMMAEHCDTHDCLKEGVTRWVPLTLESGAMFHLSFGAILGATSFNKHKEISIDKPLR